MRKPFLLLLFLALIAGNFSFKPADPAVKREYTKSELVKYLQETRDGVLDAVKGLSDEQLNYKPNPDRWSVAECVEHIMIVEKSFIGMVDGMLAKPANPERRTEVKIKDEDIVKGVSDRSHKVKAPEHTYSSNQELIKAFTEQKNQLIAFVEGPKGDELRNHIADMQNFGPVDAFQVLLLDAAHTSRHTQQLKEVMADPGFPKK